MKVTCSTGGLLRNYFANLNPILSTALLSRYDNYSMHTNPWSLSMPTKFSLPWHRRFYNFSFSFSLPYIIKSALLLSIDLQLRNRIGAAEHDIAKPYI